LRAALAGRWSPLGAVIAAILGTGYLVGLAGLVLLVEARPPTGPTPREVTIAVTIAGNNVSLPGVGARAADAAALEVLLLRSGAALEWTGEDPLVVPAVFLDKLPANMTTLQSTAQRKRLFIGAVLPLVLAVNDRIERVRTRVAALHKQQRSGRALGPAEIKWLARTATAFKTKPKHLDQLLVRADTVPVPIALAQAAIESGWGTSRFAREGNALFGQWTWQRGGGLVPERRETGADHSVRSFPRLIDSVIAYVHNLNTHRAYAKFRKARTALRDAGGASAAGGLNPMIEGLSPYSTRGPAYVKEINTLIRQNRLSGLRDAHLVEPAQRLAERNAR
jgi:Bax protein